MGKRTHRPVRRRTTVLMTGFPPRVRALIETRSCHLCEICGDYGVQVHHRLPRKSGGRHGEAKVRVNSPANGLMVCTVCHDVAEGRSVVNRWGNRIRGSREESRRNGWLLRERDAATEVAVLTAVGWQRFDDLGRSHRIPQEAL